MMTRTIKTTVTFARPFSLSGFDGQQPAGSYSVETDEELLEGMSFPAYRRMATMMQLNSSASLKGSASGILQVAVIDPTQLAAALAADAVQNGGIEVGAAGGYLNALSNDDRER
jgi:hypothetical protein